MEQHGIPRVLRTRPLAVARELGTAASATRGLTARSSASFNTSRAKLPPRRRPRGRPSSAQRPSVRLEAYERNARKRIGMR